MESFGQECQFPGCSVTDFLCTKCADCKRHFCEAHATHGAHQCAARRSENTVAVCPLCSCVVHVNAGASPDFAINRHIEGGCRPATGAPTVTPAFGPAGYPGHQQQPQAQRRGFGGFGFGAPASQPAATASAAHASPKLFCSCGVAGCTQTAVQPVRCDHCARDFCLTHRTPEAHACAPFLQRKKAETEYRIAVTGGHRTGAPTTYFDGPVEYANKPSAAFTLRPGRVAEPTDLLVVVFFDASVTALPPSAAATARRGPVPKPFFLSVAPSNPVGRLLDTCCSLAAPPVRNSNADFAVPASDTVHLYAAHRGQAVAAMSSAISNWCNDPRQLKPGEIAGVFVVLRGESPIPKALPRALLAALAARSPPPPPALPAQSCHQQHMMGHQQQQQQQQHQYPYQQHAAQPAYRDYRQQQYQQYLPQQQQQQQQQQQGHYPGCYVC